MITTKRQLSEQILRILSGGDISDDSAYDLREIILLIDQVVSLLIKANWFDNLKLGYTAVGTQYISTFQHVSVLKDKALGLFFIQIPCNYVDLPDSRGIHQLSPMKDQGAAFVPVSNGSSTLFSHSKASELEGRTGFYAENNRIYFTTDLYDQGCKTLLLKLIVPPVHSVGIDEPYPIGGDIETAIIEKVLQLMRDPVKTDQVNDNNNSR